MRQAQLGRTGITVGDWSLGTMTFGTQTPPDDAFRQMDMAAAAGHTLFDTAEAYPVNPMRAETTGRTEEIVGQWLARAGNRNRVVLATKVAGPGSPVRGGQGYDGALIPQAIDRSLKRLQTDVIDLYQLHWPVRGGYMWRRNWDFDPSGQNRAVTLAHMDDVLGAMQDAVVAGKVRAFGLSNESCWGTTRWIDRAAALGAPVVATVQNEYSLLHRLYDTDMAEMAVNEGVTLLAYSPLGAGFLTGKYQGGAVPAGSRLTLNPGMFGRQSGNVEKAVAAYLKVAADHGVDAVQMSLAWHRTRPFPSIPIYGATTAAQLERIIAGSDLVLTDACVKDIEAAHRAHPMPF
jgi:aryl-alcohol dehydrogenase-like predicted oxidoreductase